MTKESISDFISQVAESGLVDKYLVRLRCNADDIPDVRQEVFVKLMKSVGSVKSLEDAIVGGYFSQYLMEVVKSVKSNYERVERRVRDYEKRV